MDGALPTVYHRRRPGVFEAVKILGTVPKRLEKTPNSCGVLQARGTVPNLFTASSILGVLVVKIRIPGIVVREFGQ